MNVSLCYITNIPRRQTIPEILIDPRRTVNTPRVSISSSPSSSRLWRILKASHPFRSSSISSPNWLFQSLVSIPIWGARRWAGQKPMNPPIVSYRLWYLQNIPNAFPTLASTSSLFDAFRPKASSSRRLLTLAGLLQELSGSFVPFSFASGVG
jgi:hypothetical protein